MNSKERAAREILILGVLSGYPTIADKVGQSMVDAFVEATADYAVEALRAACRDFQQHDVPDHNFDFPLNAPQLAKRTAMWDGIIRRQADKGQGLAVGSRGVVSYPIGASPPEGYVPLGPMRVDFGHGAIDMSAMSHEEKEAVLRSQGRVAIEGKPEVTARLQRVTDK